MSKSTKWDFQHVAEKSKSEFCKKLSGQSSEGWELISIVRDDEGNFVGFMKRKAQKAKKKNKASVTYA